MTPYLAHKLANNEETVWDWQLVQMLMNWIELHERLARAAAEDVLGETH